MPDSNGNLQNNSRRTILFVITKLGIGGTEGHLIKILPILNKEDFIIKLFVIKSNDKFDNILREKGIEVNSGVTSRYTLIRVLLTIIKLLHHYRTVKPDLIHFFLPEAYIIGGICSFITPHSMLLMSRRSLNNYQKQHKLIKFIERLLHKRMDTLLGNSQAVANQLVLEGINKEKISVIYNGININGYQHKSENLKMQEKNKETNSNKIVLCPPQHYCMDSLMHF